jgi:uncharacterized membrane protein
MALLTLASADAGSASSFTAAMEHVAQGFEALGAAILVAGVVWSAALAIVAWRRSRAAGRTYAALRTAFGGTVLLALEVLVAADLIRTVAVAPTMTNVLVLGLIVLIRTFLSRHGAARCPAARAPSDARPARLCTRVRLAAWMPPR